jgi:hypothetical protein
MTNGKWKMENQTSAPDPSPRPENNTPEQYFSIYTQFRIEDMLPMH